MSTTFSPATWGFLARLAAANTKATFDAERATYRAEVVEPSGAYVERMAEVLPEVVHPGLRAEAKVGRSLFRINRDLRFARDAEPYKTHLDFLFWIGDGAPRDRPACIVRLTSTTVLLGAGRAGVRGEALARYRSRLDDPDDGARVRRVVAALTDGGAELSEPDRVRVPRGFTADHPSAELLRRDGFHLSQTRPHPPEIEGDGFADWCADRLAAYAALLAWLAEG